MKQPCCRYQQDWHLLALGALDADLQEEMSLHLRECSACQTNFLESKKMQSAISLLARQHPRAANRNWWPLLPWVVAAGSLAALLFVYSQWSREAARYESMVAMLAARPDGEIVLNVVDPEVRAAEARAVWSRAGGLVFMANNLPRLPQHKCYQLWVLRSTAPSVVSAGLVSRDAGGRGLLISNPGTELDQVTGFAITDEPRGGSIVARGRKLLVGTH